MAIRYEIDEVMIGGDEAVSVTRFAAILQDVCEDMGLDIEVVAINDPYDGASTCDPGLSVMLHDAWMEAERRYWGE